MSLWKCATGSFMWQQKFSGTFSYIRFLYPSPASHVHKVPIPQPNHPFTYGSYTSAQPAMYIWFLYPSPASLLHMVLIPQTSQSFTDGTYIPNPNFKYFRHHCVCMKQNLQSMSSEASPVINTHYSRPEGQSKSEHGIPNLVEKIPDALPQCYFWQLMEIWALWEKKIRFIKLAESTSSQLESQPVAQY